MPKVAINIVTHNSEAHIGACLDSVAAQVFSDRAVTVLDNASTDGTLKILDARSDIHVIRNRENRYYAGGHNQGIEVTDSEFVLTLNPDVTLRPDFLGRAVGAFELSPRIGSVNGKLLLAEAGHSNVPAGTATAGQYPLIDSAGLMLYRSRRPYLRGNRLPAISACVEPAYIFGADGACALYRRSTLRDVATEGEVFDSDFVMYREDVDLAWRSQILGWDSYYVPQAVGTHVRAFHLGRGRRSMSPDLRRHSVKNGWLLLLKHESTSGLARDLGQILPYQAKIALGLVLTEQTSLPAVADLVRLLPRMIRKRHAIERRRGRSDVDIRRWLA